MAYGFDFECGGCDYGLRAFIGRGMRYSPQAVFYGRGGGAARDWPAEARDPLDLEMPMLLTLADHDGVADVAYSLLTAGAEPTELYWQSLYACPECCRLYNRFFFQLQTGGGVFEPDYWCPHCRLLLEPADFDLLAAELKLYLPERRGWLDWHCPGCGTDEPLRRRQRFVWN